MLTSFPALGIGFFPQQVFCCCFLQSLADVCGVSMGIPLELKEGTERLTGQRWSYSEEEQLDLQKKKLKEEAKEKRRRRKLQRNSLRT